MFTVGSSVELGSGNVGLEPSVAGSGSLDVSPQAAIGSAQAPVSRRFLRTRMEEFRTFHRTVSRERPVRARVPKNRLRAPRGSSPAARECRPSNASQLADVDRHLAQPLAGGGDRK